MKRISLIILCIFVIFIFSGCWSRREAKTFAILSSIIYDINEENNYEITTEIINPSAIGKSKESSNGKNSFFIVIGEGASLPDAVKNLSLSASNFGAHNKARFFSEKIVQQDITQLLDYLLREKLSDEKPLMFVIKDDDPKKIYSCEIGLSDTIGAFIQSISKSQTKVLSESVFIDTMQFIKDYYNDGKEPVLGLIQLNEYSSPEKSSQDSSNDDKNSEIKYEIAYEGLAAFKDNKLIGYFNGAEARSYNFIINNIKSSIISSKIGEDYTTFRINKSKTNIKTKIENDQIMINVKISIDAMIVQETEEIDITKMKTLEMLEEVLNRQIEQEISSAVIKAQNDFQSDIFGFGSQFHIDHPKEWKEIKENWNEKFSKATIIVTVDSKVSRTGQLKKSLTMEE